MFRKRAVIFCASAGASCKKAIQTIKDSLFFWGVPSIITYGLPVQAANWDTVKPERKAKIEKDIARITAKINPSKPPRVGLKTKFIFGIMKCCIKRAGIPPLSKKNTGRSAAGSVKGDRGKNKHSRKRI